MRRKPFNHADCADCSCARVIAGSTALPCPGLQFHQFAVPEWPVGGRAGVDLFQLRGESVDQKAYNLGVLVPFGAFELRGQYTASTIETAAGDVDVQKYGASLRYSLSKRTQLYAAVTQRTGDDNLDDLFPRKTEYVFGVGHNF